MKNKKIADDIFTVLDPEFSTEIGVIHSNKSQPQRFAAVKYFEEGVHRLLIATDIIARGLDLSDVSHVVNFDIPKEASTYIHRIGRTGRAEKNCNGTHNVVKAVKADLIAKLEANGHAEAAEILKTK